MNSAIAHYWEQADTLGQLVGWFLLLMSVLSWTLILFKAWTFWRIRKTALVLQTFWLAPTMTDAIAMLRHADKAAMFVTLADTASAAVDTGQRATTFSAHSESDEVLTRNLRQELQRLTVKLESGLTLLASIGATAPFVGLLGTVWGIYHALTAISSSGAVQIDQLAGPVGEALIMTALGLVVAIPAVLAYNGFNRINRITLAELDGFAFDLHAHMSQSPAKC
ncbi:MotA/TolQ/ExbB proton channel family protein [Undibacterium sp. TJN19]|uniref:MotA/TolQ/ExbB proton channel family protein n=1 Tax=Undibacterium sp. TJN19 TaxID=3413055 RepID=UPI003BF0A3CD